jgi:hypothetical protein
VEKPKISRMLVDWFWEQQDQSQIPGGPGPWRVVRSQGGSLIAEGDSEEA